MPSDAKTFHMTPGDGVYLPVHAPHMVKNGPDVSISFSITFYTEASERLGDLHSVNSRLRKLHLSPGLPGKKPRSDQLKSSAWRGMRKVNRTGRKLIGRGQA